MKLNIEMKYANIYVYKYVLIIKEAVFGHHCDSTEILAYHGARDDLKSTFVKQYTIQN